MGLDTKKSMLIVFAIGTAVFLAVALMQTRSGNELLNKIDSLRVESIPSQLDAKFKEQRNELSRALNEMKKLYGQQSCNMLSLKAKTNKGVYTEVSENGGWCAHMSGANSSAHLWDQGLSIALSSFLKGKTVASFGDGPGMYKKHMDEMAEVKSYSAFDGAPFCENTTDGRVKFLDLSAPQYGLQAYDWVISIEVGEHIPAKYEDIYLDNIARHAKEGVILSWAVPGQGGLSHVNNKPLEDVVKQMDRRHFSFNSEHGKPFRDASTFWWLKGNIHVYHRKDPATFIPEDV